jgi:4a-hydroxytetrahydrobiopterin dehydratase
MSEALTEQRCKPCEGGVAPLSLHEAQTLMEQLSGAWKLAADGRSIRGEWKFRNFYHAMSFTNAVAHIANTEDHHPDLEVGYGYCRMTYHTHAIGGLSQNDFICAAKVDALPRS